jgi:N utilization substance protein A
MRVTLTDEARRYAKRFADVTDVTPRDCLVRDGGDRLVIVVPVDRLGEAVGPEGATVARVEDLLDARIDLIEDADTPEAFVANAFAPAAVRGVTISEQGGGRVAFAEVLDADRGVAIGTDGERIEAVRDLAARHFDVDDVELA